LAAILGGGGRIVGFAALAGLFVGAVAGVPKVIVIVRPKIAVAVLAAFCGWTTATIGYVLGDFAGWAIAPIASLGIVGVIDVFYVGTPEEGAAGYRLREGAISITRAAVAG
jgi:hypothetical protein